jgi:hypothetical protein
MADETMPPEQVLTLLASAPERIAAATTALTPAQLRTSLADGEWSAIEVLAHLRSCADVWGDCIATMLVEERPTLREVHPSAWIRQTDYPDLEFGPSLQAFVAQRADLLATLSSLTPQSWARSATVTGAGKPLERTVLFYARWLARHEQTHVKWFERIAGVLKLHCAKA